MGYLFPAPLAPDARRPPGVSSESSTVRWLVRCLMKYARPIARGDTRLAEGPPSAVAFTTRRSSRSRTWWLCSALAMADRSTFSMRRAAAFGVYCSAASASPTDLPRMCSRTSRALDAGTRTKRAVARVLTVASRLPGRRCRRLFGRTVRLEGTRQGELPEAMADHVLRDIDGDELATVVDSERVADELGQNRGPP